MDSERSLRGDDFTPGVPHQALESSEWNVHRVLINGVELEFIDDVLDIRLLIRGDLEDGLIQQVLQCLLQKWKQKTKLKFEVGEFDRFEGAD